MRLLWLALAIVPAAAVMGSPAAAQNYPWCAYYGPDNGENCGFSTYEQCMQDVSGIGGYCVRNNQYVPPAGHEPSSNTPRQQQPPSDEHSHS